VAGNTTGAAALAALGTTVLVGGNGSEQQLEVMSQDRGNVQAGFVNNFAYGTLALAAIGGLQVRLVGNAHNTTGTGPQALYVGSLIVPVGTALDLNGLHVYARAAQVDGAVLNGTVRVLPDGGPLPLDRPAPGTIAPAGDVDDWTFFGRAGQSVTVTVGTGAGGVPAPVQPTLNDAQVTLLDANAQTLATAANGQAGADVVLAAVGLPADGTYHVRVQAGPGGSTGNYVVTVGDASVHTAALNLDQPAYGRLNTPFAIDHWTFAAGANDQVQFHVINAAPGVQFDLTGPGGYAGFSGLTADSNVLTLPASGTYTVTAHAAPGQAGAYAFALEQAGALDLTPGTPYQGTLIGTGQGRLFQVSLSTAQSLLFTLADGSAGDQNELYVKFGAPPTRTSYDYRFTNPGAANQQIAVDWNTYLAPAVCYVLVYAADVPVPSPFTLTAAVGKIFVTGLTPSQHGTSTDLTVSVTGVGFFLPAGAVRRPAPSLRRCCRP
jgi:hypothetical protein